MTAGVTTADPKEFAVDCAASTVAPGVRQRHSVLSLERHAVAAVVLVVMLGFALRIRGLDRVGFNEDEIQKVNAARAYLHGDFSHNLEHPMLMKSMLPSSRTAHTLSPSSTQLITSITNPSTRCWKPANCPNNGEATLLYTSSGF